MELGHEGLKVGSFTSRKTEMEKMKIRKTKLEGGYKSHSGLDAAVLPGLAKEEEEEVRV